MCRAIRRHVRRVRAAVRKACSICATHRLGDEQSSAMRSKLESHDAQQHALPRRTPICSPLDEQRAACVLPCAPMQRRESVHACAVPPALCAAHMHFLVCACGSALSKLPPPAVGPLPLLLVGGHNSPRQKVSRGHADQKFISFHARKIRKPHAKIHYFWAQTALGAHEKHIDVSAGPQTPFYDG